MDQLFNFKVGLKLEFPPLLVCLNRKDFLKDFLVTLPLYFVQEWSPVAGGAELQQLRELFSHCFLSLKWPEHLNTDKFVPNSQKVRTRT